MKITLTVYGQSNSRERTQLLVGHQKLQEPTWVDVAAMKATEEKPKPLVYTGIPAPRTVELDDKVAASLGLL